MVRRSLLVLAAGVVAAAAMLALQQVILLFLFVTIGGRGLDIAGLLFARTFFGLDAIVITAACGVPSLLFLARSVGALRKKGIAVLVASFGILELLALSYRFPSLVVAAAGVWLVWRHSRRGWSVLACAAILAFSPADVSLRVRPEGFRWAEAIAGDLAVTPTEFDASGRRVWLGGSSLVLNEPRWVWVW
jgi:hypothetical protein